MADKTRGNLFAWHNLFAALLCALSASAIILFLTDYSKKRCNLDCQPSWLAPKRPLSGGFQ